MKMATCGHGLHRSSYW